MNLFLLVCIAQICCLSIYVLAADLTYSHAVASNLNVSKHNEVKPISKPSFLDFEEPEIPGIRTDNFNPQTSYGQNAQIKPKIQSGGQNGPSYQNVSLISDQELEDFSDSLLKLDVNNVAKYVTVNFQGKIKPTNGSFGPFLSVQPQAVTGPTISKLLKLLDNYERDVWLQEKQTNEELAEEEEFIDAIVETPVMEKLRDILIKKGLVTSDPKSFKGKIRQLWFDLYSRQKGRVSSCGFEHVFLAELKNNEIIGLHNWIYFHEQERTNHASYLGYRRFLDMGDKGKITKISFVLDKIQKPVTNMFVGTSPELEMSIYTACFLLRAGQPCPQRFGTSKFNIKAWPIRYHNKRLIGSVYPEI